MTTKYEVSAYGEATMVFDDPYEAGSHITSLDTYIDNLEVDVDEYIDESYGKFEIAGAEFWASQILRELDDTMYREIETDLRNNTAENDADWLGDELRGMSDGDEETYSSVTVRCFEEYDDEDEADEDGHNIEDFTNIFA